jgi:hypothetical protein
MGLHDLVVFGCILCFHPALSKDLHDTGKYRIEGDQCCITYDKILAGLPLCIDLYRHPGGSFENKDEYLQVNDFGMYPVSYVD